MSGADGPVCPHHAGEVRMALVSLHSDRGRPGEVMGAYRCPQCGHERRLPLDLGGDEGGSPALGGGG
ncbi:MAG TPA: hypothetical protein VFD01_02950 [Candidatus Dormibacteraeota bacterium]|jgi:hypothetical protein|nr:hypothetical protein [Candidatus Dormibacteraeota bacterium]